MNISRAIIDTSLVILCFAVLMYLTWESSSTATAIEQVTQQQKATQFIDKASILKNNHVYQIEDITATGHLLIPELKGQWKINDKRFHRIETAKLAQLQKFFVGRFVKIEDTSGEKIINLPAELYDPRCFANSLEFTSTSGQCPVLLKP